MRWLGLVALAGLVVGCSGPLIGRSGQVTVGLGPAEEVTVVCTKLLGPPPAGRYWRGCMRVVPALRAVDIWCPFNDAECLAHEVDHLVRGDFHD